MKISEAIKSLLETHRNEFNSDLFDRVLKYGCDMEIQVNVSPGVDGEPVEGRNSTFTNGLDTWWSFRIPKGAYTNEASWRDMPMQYNLLEHVDAIGLTGWDWKAKTSRWVTFDFDSIAGHAQGVGISDHELEKVRKAVQELDYVEVRRSTGGRGLHLYVPLEVPTQNHTEHQHLAGFVLRRISEDVGFDLFNRVDVLGGNCFAGDTQVLTRQGLKSIKDLAGLDVEVFTKRGKKVVAPFKSYGDQEVYAITLASNGGATKTIKATKDHGWFVHRGSGTTQYNVARAVEVNTSELRVGDKLHKCKPFRSNSMQPSLLGIQHGVMTGDGTSGEETKSGAVTLCGPKTQLAEKVFVGHTYTLKGDFIHITNMPKHWKTDLPELHWDKGYLLGWLMGYMGTDGSVHKNTGGVSIASYSKKNLEHARQVCQILGIETGPVRPSTNAKGTTSFWININRGDIPTGFFLLDHHQELFDAVPISNYQKHWKVVSVEPSGVEEVFCCSVPDTHCFMLEDFIMTSNCWIFAKRATLDKRSFECLKASKCDFSYVTDDWQDTLHNIRAKKARVNIQDGKATVFQKLTSAHRKVSLTDHHKKVRTALAEMGCCIWDSGMHLLKTHTKLIENLMTNEDLDIQGVFKTTSPGSDLTGPNCFMFPMDEDAWVIYRFGPGTSEHGSWTQDGKSFTSCFFNKKPDLNAAASALGGSKTKSGGFSFPSLGAAINTLNSVSDGADLDLSGAKHLETSPATLGTSKNGEIYVEVKSQGMCPDGWNETDKKGHYTLVTPFKATQNVVTLDYDEQVRALRTPNRDAAGWGIEHEDKTWTRVQGGDCKKALNAYGHADSEANVVMGRCILNSWTLTSEPFTPELPGDRRWNINAPQLVYDPEPFDGLDDPHPTWTMILKHVGLGLDSAVKRHKWCQENGIVTGQQYLLNWVTSVFQHPHERLPYLALYGGQNTGKSMFGEAIALLVTCGVTNIDRYLAGSDFNGELEGAIIGVVEERNIGGSQNVVNRIKALVTSPTIQVRRMRNDPYTVTNYVNCIQNTNSLDGLPKFDGSDTRITLIEVQPPSADIPKGELVERLKSEAGFFTHTLLTHHIPPTDGRLRVPVVETELKKTTANLNTDPVDLFLETCCDIGTNYSVALADFVKAMKASDTSGANVTKKHIIDTLRKNSAMRVDNAAGGKLVICGLRLKGGTNVGT